MARKLTTDEIETCERFERLLKSLRTGPVCCVSVSCGQGYISAFAHDRYAAHSGDRGQNTRLAESLQSALDKVHEANPDGRTAREKRVAELQAELAQLQKEAA